MRTKYLMIVIAIPRPYRACQLLNRARLVWNVGVPVKAIGTDLMGRA